MSLLLRLLLACGVAAPQPVAEPVVEAPASSLAFVERLVGTEDGSVPLPTVIVVHGLGARADGIVRVLEGLEGPARVLAPQAPTPWGDGGTWFSMPAQGSDPAALGEEMLRVADRVVAWIDEVRAEHPIAGRPVITGFSQGGMVSFAVALRHPEAVAGAVPIAGWLPGVLVPPLPTEAQRAVPIRALHGTADDRLSFVETRRVVDALRAAGFDAQLQAAEGVGHTIPPEVRAEVVRTVGVLLPPR
ncbi:MAG: alpha/beta fold hydrolase [Alphaproteobacteria bacterium]|nr:alpha/beta fold hydrolase [Alphaproteobacteria bacterium]